MANIYNYIEKWNGFLPLHNRWMHRCRRRAVDMMKRPQRTGRYLVIIILMIVLIIIILTIITYYNNGNMKMLLNKRRKCFLIRYLFTTLFMQTNLLKIGNRNNALYFKVIYIVWYNVFRMLMLNQLKNYCHNKHIKSQYYIEAS